MDISSVGNNAISEMHSPKKDSDINNNDSAAKTKAAYEVEISDGARKIAENRMEQKKINETIDPGNIPDEIMQNVKDTYDSRGKLLA